MELHILWILKLLTAHFLTDFVLQPSSWIDDRYTHHYKSGKLYIHVLITTFFAWLFVGFAGWEVPVVIFITHYLIDLWKSYREKKTSWFLLDQLFHLLVILVLWLIVFPGITSNLKILYDQTDARQTWAYFFALLFLSQPASIIIGKLTQKWRTDLGEDDNSLEKAGKWIGIVERLIIFILVILSQYQAIGLLVAAKSILRFNETRRAEKKSEYVLIGTLFSIGTALFTGLAVKLLIS